LLDNAVIFAQSKNCGARETAIASERLWSISFWATAMKHTVEQRPLLGSRFLISKNRRPLLGKGSVNLFLWQWIHMQQRNGVFYMVHTLNLVSQSVNRRLSWSCKSAQLEGSCCSERTWAWKQRNSHVGAVTRQLLVKTLQAVKDLMCTLVNCKVWKLAMAL
jgi:hypothetical protein